MLRKRIGNDRASAEGTEPLHWLYSSIGKYLSYRRIKPISHCGGYGTCRKGKCVKKNLRKINDRTEKIYAIKQIELKERIIKFNNSGIKLMVLVNICVGIAL